MKNTESHLQTYPNFSIKQGLKFYEINDCISFKHCYHSHLMTDYENGYCATFTIFLFSTYPNCELYRNDLHFQATNLNLSQVHHFKQSC